MRGVKRGVKTGGIILALLLALAVPADAQHISAQIPQQAQAPAANAMVQGGTLANSTQTSASQTAQTITVTGVAGQRACLRTIVVYVSVAGNVTLVVKDGATTKLDFGTIAATTGPTVFTGNPLMCASTGSSLLVTVGADSAVGTSTLSIAADLY